MASSSSTLMQDRGNTVRDEVFSRDKKGDLSQTTDFEWPGRHEFQELGAFLYTFDVSLSSSPITVGVFHDTYEDVYFMASCHPRVIAMGAAEDEVVRSWTAELIHTWQAARRLKPPFGAATENDIECLKAFFGSL